MELEKKFAVVAHEPYLRQAEIHGFQRGRATHQIDTYFILNQPHEDGTRHYLRIREDIMRGTLSLDYHRVLNELETDEIEEVILRKETFVRILHFLGYEPLCVVDKQRNLYRHGPVEITFDQVARLGYFIEVEIQGVPNSDTEGLLNETIALLGLHDEQRIVKRGYPDLLLERLQLDPSTGS